MHGRTDWQTIKTVGERFPQLDVVSSFALVVEAVDSDSTKNTHQSFTLYTG